MKIRFLGIGLLIAVAAICPAQVGWASGNAENIGFSANSSYRAAGGQGSDYGPEDRPQGEGCQKGRGKSRGHGQDKGVRDHGEGKGGGKGQGKGKGGQQGQGHGRGRDSGR